MNTPHITTRDWLIYSTISIVWGTSFILIKQGLLYFDPLTVSALRISISGLLLMPFALKGLYRLSNKQKIFAVLMGLTGSGIPSFLYPLAQQHIDSGVAGVLNSLTPIFIVVNGFIFFNVRYTKMQLSGIAAGFIGAALLIILHHKPTESDTNNYIYGLVIVSATFLYGLSNQILVHFLKGLDAIVITSVAFFFMGIMAAGILTQTEFIAVLKHNPDAWRGVLYVTLLAGLGSALAMVLYNYLAARTGVTFSGTVTYVMPVVALMWSVVAGEFIGMQHIAAMLIILVGVYLVRRAI
ncbi:MAG: EamA family transporter [Bacteroidetes bacterium]|nr:EamA family transporter [Bacteroidota bacterium]